MNKNLKLVINNTSQNFDQKYFFEKNELKIIVIGSIPQTLKLTQNSSD